jgi:large repetitive protein
MRLPGALLGVLLGVTVPMLGQVTVTNNNPLPYGSVGVTYSAQLTATPVGQPYQWSIIQGNLPAGLNLNAQTGEIAGMPTVGGTQTFTVRALSPQQQSGTKQLSIGILQIGNPSPLPGATLGTFYSITFNTSDGPASAIYTWQPGQPPPPPGFTLATNGVLSGTPTSTGTFNFQIFVFDQKDGIQATKNFSITVAGSLVITTPSPLPNGDAGSPYKVTLDATGGTTPYHWNVLSGLPLGLNLDPNAGIVSGTPLNPGQFSFSVQVIDSANSAGTKTFSLTINPALKINGSFPSGTVGLAYSQAISAIGGQSPYTFSVQSTPFNPNPAPPGLGLSAGGVLSGVPTTAGSYNFGVLLTDGIGAQVSMPFALTVNPSLAFSTPSPLPSGTVGAAYSQPIMATGGTPPYTFSTTTPPPGLTLDASGVLSGTPTAAGTFQFNVTVTDGARTSVIKAFQISVVGGVAAMLQVSPLSLAFTASVGGDSPAPQTINVTPVDANTATFTLTIEGASAGTAAPAWISARPSVVGTAPARIIISVNQGSMQAGNYSARVRIMDASQNSYVVSVSLTVTNDSPQLEVTPNFLRFAARFQTPGTFEQTITVRNSGGGGTLGFSTSVLNASSWISSVLPTSGQTVRNALVSVKVRINTQGLKVGSHRDVIRFTFTGGSVDVTVSVFVADNGSIIGLSVTGLRFQARQGGGYSNTQTVQVYNFGDPATTVNWKAEIVSGANWLTLSPSSGIALSASPGIVSFGLTQDATQLPPGGYYALVRILDSGSQNSPRYVVAVFDLASSATPPLPDPSPVGLLFTGVAGGAQPASQVVRVNTSSAQTVTWTAAALTSDGVAWISLTPSVGRSTGQSPGILLISVNTIGLAPGIYTGEVSIAIAGGPIRTVSITLIVLPGGSIAPPATATPAAAATPSASCTPSKLALTQTGLVNNFAVPAKWPANLIVLLNDDCGASILNGSVVASFSNGDPPLTLRSDTQMGAYSATWQAGVVTQQMVVTIHAEAGSLQPATAQLIGTISPNTAPVLFKNGTVNVFNRVSGGALAPGTIVEVYGTGLASGTATLGVLPLPNIFNGTIVVIGGFQVPLYYLSDGQLDAEIAVDLPANQQHAIVVSANGALTLPDQIDVVPVQLGVAAYADGHAIAQHGVDFSYVTASSPAKPGEVLVIYLSGMGPTNPAVKSGDPAPGLEPLARVTLPPTVMVDNQNADVGFAGLSPGLVGLYQVNFTVPPTAKNGDLNLILVQNGVTANITKLPVAK